MANVAEILEDVETIKGELTNGDNAVAAAAEKRAALEARAARIAELLGELKTLVMDSQFQQDAENMGAAITEAGKRYDAAMQGLNGLTAETDSEHVETARQWGEVALYQIQGDRRAEVEAVTLLTAIGGMQEHLAPLVGPADEAVLTLDGLNANLTRAENYSALSVQALSTYQEAIS
ncbi:MAG TPA: hypothetical protein VLH86_04590 [Patescibacteria group bacterium]|nr:hypothetical protein [Patescibacteria group bacterium]